ncbi:hypothetical protein CA606_10525 [Caulobacter vibrioides]|uniref:AB hydrolase-1 domain-containing protein n=1 Tax=Caulobacter vibrioides TaxID=155892 RepID=A0A290MSB7_CAUVI|nr:alpha/beta fold hydrolase [Caulobacter vibrioides]ATC32742.1 hypothetical protein CA606_10525 [Caulobacter vibrioides]
MSTSSFIYCHGLPGSAAELELFGGPDLEGASVVCLERLQAGRDHLDWQDRLLAAFDAARANLDRPTVRLVAFSLGTMSALHIAAKRPDAIEAVDVISAAAPLELGDFLPRMAGKAVFQAAATSPGALRRLGHGQSLINAIAPSFLLKVMFAGAAASEQALLADADFRAAVRDGLTASLGRGRAAYEDELRTYVRPWSQILSSVGCPVTLWHGDADGWAPLDMAYALAKALPSGAAVTEIAGAGHFDALKRALPAILRQG